MTFKHILVQADDRAQTADRLRIAVDIANRFGASLEAVFPKAPVYLPLAMDGAISAQIMDAQRSADTVREEEARALFDTHTAALKGAALWTVEEGPPLTVFTNRARYADLAIVGQTDPATKGSTVDYDLPAESILEAGRPVLIVPYAGHYKADFNNILVGWNRSREAARAIGDAMPFLTAAEKVTIFSVALKPMRGVTDEPGEALRDYFHRHGITATNDQIPAQDHVKPSDLMLSRAADLGVDMIVMGGYGHSRIRELVLGGVTHDILDHMTVPVLMSH